MDQEAKYSYLEFSKSPGGARAKSCEVMRVTFGEVKIFGYRSRNGTSE